MNIYPLDENELDTGKNNLRFLDVTIISTSRNPKNRVIVLPHATEPRTERSGTILATVVMKSVY